MNMALILHKKKLIRNYPFYFIQNKRCLYFFLGLYIYPKLLGNLVFYFPAVPTKGCSQKCSLPKGAIINQIYVSKVKLLLLEARRAIAQYFRRHTSHSQFIQLELCKKTVICRFVNLQTKVNRKEKKIKSSCRSQNYSH